MSNGWTDGRSALCHHYMARRPDWWVVFTLHGFVRRGYRSRAVIGADIIMHRPILSATCSDDYELRVVTAKFKLKDEMNTHSRPTDIVHC